ncbi:MAG: hypothetical protein AAFY60_16820, partial [Myxococcota bacterium]
EPPCEPDLFSRACVEAYHNNTAETPVYPFTQIFEPGVLAEVVLLEGVPLDPLLTLEFRPTAEMESLGNKLDNLQSLDMAERLNLSSALICISRFDAAKRALPREGSTDRERFELAWLDFLISNRQDDGARSPDAFARIIAATAQGEVSPARIVDACTQGIVWFLKRREIDEQQYRWCVETGNALIKHGAGLGHGTLSSWYRGVAMVRAVERDAEGTREYLTQALDHGTRLADSCEQYGALNTLKTYYESCIKEYMYVRPDLERAEEAGLALVALDEQWSPSFAELAEAYEYFGQVEQAVVYYEKAVDIGPPYVGQHLVRAARANVKCGSPEAALGHYRTLHDIAPLLDPHLCREALRVATESGHDSKDYFQSAFEASQARGVTR